MSTFYIIKQQSDLAHHGIKGQKWGVRRYQNDDGTLTDAGRKRYAKDELRNAKHDYKYKVKQAKANMGLGIGIKGIEKVNKAVADKHKAENELSSAKAKYARDTKGNKGEFKSWSKQMYKNGLPGSIKDEKSDGKSSRLYDQITREKGKDYADSVLKKVQNKAYAEIAIGTAISAAGAAYLLYDAYKK